MTKLERVIQYMDTNLSNSGLAYIMADACYEWGGKWTDFVEELQSCSAEEAGEDIRNNLEEYARILVDNDVYDTGDDGLDSILESEED